MASKRSPASTAPAKSRRLRIAAGRRLFGRYRIERQLGHGGSAEVWLAHDERLDRTVAIKAPLPDALPDAAARDRFVNEARAAASLNHPAIVPVFDVVGDPTTPVMVLRYVDGETLAARLARAGRLDPAAAAAIGADLAGALAHAHAAGVVHRDVKPGNVLLDAEGRAQLLDFGIAGSLAEPGETAGADPGPREVRGTLRYMAPEQLRGGAVDARSDLYALGLVIHEMLTGVPAFDPASPTALAEAQRTGPPPLPPAVPARLRALLTALLAVDPDDRPSDAIAVEARLAAEAHELAATRRGSGPPGIAPTIAPGLPAATAGLALLTVDDGSVRPAPDDQSHATVPAVGVREADTAPLPAAVTAALRPIDGPSEPGAASARPVNLAAAAAGSGRAASRESVQSTRGRARHSGLYAAVAGGLIVAAIAVAAFAGGFARLSPIADASPSVSVIPASAAPTQRAEPVAPPQAPKPKPHHGHGRGGGG